MLRIHGTKDSTSEYKAAEALANAAIIAMPEIEQERDLVLNIFPSIQCFGQRYQDIDLLVIFADYTDRDKPHGIHSFCACIEVKSHSGEDVRFEGAKCIVKYNHQDHDVTTQSEGQKYSVLDYIKKNSKNKSAPYIHNLIWLTSVSKTQLPKTQNNIVGMDSKWEDFCYTLSMLNGEKPLTSFSYRNYLNSICEIFSRKLQPSKIDRKRLENITKSVLDRTQQQYAEKLGKQLLIYRGRGGTGKTVRLIRTAYQAYDEMGLRVILLTYNRALVADLRRLLALLGAKDAVGRGSISIKTIQSFTHEWLVQLGVIDKQQPNFLVEYDSFMKTALTYIRNGALSNDDISLAKTKASKHLAWDLILIDESQDWPASERDFIYQLYGYEKVIIADGVDQFVRGVEGIDWREGIDRTKSQIVPLHKSLRLKSSLCQAVGYFAEKIEYANWNLQPLPEAHGGRVIIVIGNALSEVFHRKLSATAKDDGNHPIDMLFCVPPNWVRTNMNGDKSSIVADQYKKWGLETWDAVDPELRGEYPTSLEQYRIVQYESCRGLEGWVVVNFGLDEFFDYKCSNAEFSEEEKSDMFFDHEESAIEYSKKWIMIPLTRAIDTLVLHVSDEASYIGRLLLELHEMHPESVQLYRY